MRLHLKPVERGDLEWILIYRNNPQNYINFNQPTPLSYDQEVEWYEREVLGKKTFAYIVYIDKQKIGYVALQNINWIVRSAEVSHFLANDINPELAKFVHEMILVIAFENLGLNRVHSVCFEFNNVCNRLEELGFKKEGLLRQSCFKNGRLWDSFPIAILKNEWKSISEGEKS
jgi:RimJ/RimL family protein N-acetyltransferase